MEAVRIQPVDVLFLRGNRSFADSNHADAVMPPWPSVFSGALRARMIEDARAAESFHAGTLTGPLAEVVGTSPSELGAFRLGFVCLERGVDASDVSVRRDSDATRRQLLFAAPADLVVSDADQISRLHSIALAELGVESSNALATVPVLRTSVASKATSGCWLTSEGMRAYLRGGTPESSQVVRSSELWKSDDRLGIALDVERRSAREGMLYTTQTVALASTASFVVGVHGAGGSVPTTGLLRLGGDGRGAALSSWAQDGQPPWDHVPNGSRFALVLATPGIFPGGWILPGTRRDGTNWVFTFGKLRARLVSAVVPRNEVVSGWDLAQRRPKPAKRSVPAGAVYWLEHLPGSDHGELARIWSEGLWSDEHGVDAQRRAEGFNSVWLADWSATED